MKGRLPDSIRIRHILESIEEIEKALEGHSFESFLDNNVLRAAVVRWLEVIGEAARYVSDETKEKYSGVAWKQMVGMRNVMIHKYFDVDYQAVWMATQVLNDLKTQLRAINLDINDSIF